MLPPEAVHATFGPATEFRPGSRRGSVSDGWHTIQCRSEGVTSQNFQIFEKSEKSKTFENYKYFVLEIQNHACMHLSLA